MKFGLYKRLKGHGVFVVPGSYSAVLLEFSKESFDLISVLIRLLFEFGFSPFFSALLSYRRISFRDIGVNSSGSQILAKSY